MIWISSDGPSKIALGPLSLFEALPTLLAEQVSAKISRIVVVTDENVEPLLPTITQSLHPAPLTFILPPGEESKCRGWRDALEDFLLDNHCDRDTCLIAFGGGVVGDLTGFAAATFLRGVAVVQVPTSLMAMVDSSVGGKTAIDVPQGKNLIGAFHMPALVLICVPLLDSLPIRHIRNGFAEIVKAALLADTHSFLEDVESLAVRLGSDTATAQVLRSPQWSSLIQRSVEVKLKYVNGDEREASGRRGLLNLGHTIGHAVEAVGLPHMLHGEAISIGIVCEARVARRLGLLPHAMVSRIENILISAGLPTVVPPHISSRLADLLEYMLHDKKNRHGAIHMALLEDIGKCKDNKPCPVPSDIICVTLSRGLTLCAPLRTTPRCVVRLTPPGSKSITNRVLELCVLGRGLCRISGALCSTDTSMMMQCLRRLSGAHVRFENRGLVISVMGHEGRLRCASEPLQIGNSGTSARFISSLCCLCEPHEGASSTLIVGSKRMSHERPMAPLLQALRQQGASFQGMEAVDRFPLRIAGTGLRGGNLSIDASKSSQFVSSLLMAAPYAQQDTRVVLTSTTSSEPYIDMTVGIMRDFGVSVTQGLEGNFPWYYVPRGGYRNPPTYVIEPDASAASALLAVAAIYGGTVTVEGLGSSSRQGDANFANTVLAAMGCEVDFQEAETTVQGPRSGVLKGAHLDLGAMGDTFMTAAVLLAGAEGVSTIRGIATQRVKECNRIKAIVCELQKLDVTCRELDDGLEIHGMRFEDMRPNTVIECYDDHRVAMAFAVLSFRVKGLVISDASCVNKTFPDFWDVMVNSFQATLLPAEPTASAHKADDLLPDAVYFVTSACSQVPITPILQDICHTNEWNFVDLTDEDTLDEITKRHRQLLSYTSFASVFEMAVKETAVNVKVHTVFLCPPPSEKDENYSASLRAQKNTLFVMESVESPVLSDPARACTRYDIFVNHVNKSKGAFSREAVRFVKFLTTPRPSREDLTMALKSTHMVSLTFKTFGGVTPAQIETVCEGCDVMEIRADHLGDWSEGVLILELSTLRSLCLNESSVMFTLRSKSQGGNFDGCDTKANMIINLALRQGCEFLDVEGTLPSDLIRCIHDKKGNSTIVLSHHDISGCHPSVIRREAQRALQYDADVVKVVVVAGDVRDCISVVDIVKNIVKDRPWMALATGVHGALSRALNTTLTPVTHEALPFPAAPGQLSLRAVNTLRSTLGMIPPKEFFVVGHPVSKSLSPVIHNTAFAALGLPHTYSRVETSDITAIRDRLRTDAFGGCSVTIPHKISVIDLVDVLSEHAEAIGAVNTLVPMGCTDSDEVVIYGDNTDWMALRRLIESRRSPSLPCRNGLVLGAGGAARSAIYALLKLQCRCIGVYNRTFEKGASVAASFKQEGVFAMRHAEEKVSGGWDVVISTLPVQADKECYPPSIFHKKNVIVVDMAYLPNREDTDVLRVASFANQDARCIRGVEVLVEQALQQFKLWTCHNAPRGKIWEAVKIQRMDRGELCPQQHAWKADQLKVDSTDSRGEDSDSD